MNGYDEENEGRERFMEIAREEDARMDWQTALSELEHLRSENAALRADLSDVSQRCNSHGADGWDVGIRQTTRHRPRGSEEGEGDAVLRVGAELSRAVF